MLVKNRLKIHKLQDQQLIFTLSFYQWSWYSKLFSDDLKSTQSKFRILRQGNTERKFQIISNCFLEFRTKLAWALTTLPLTCHSVQRATSSAEECKRWSEENLRSFPAHYHVKQPPPLIRHPLFLSLPWSFHRERESHGEWRERKTERDFILSTKSLVCK